MRSTLAIAFTATFLCLGASVDLFAASNPAMKADILSLSREWEHIKFEVEGLDEQEKEMAALAAKASAVAKKYQNAPEAVIWVGIIMSEQASMANENTSPIKALRLAIAARDVLEEVEKIDPVADDAGAPTSFGVLYYRVPGFPLGFGDKTKARKYLLEAVKNAPNGLDANYFYGDFLFQQGEYTEAGQVLRRALSLPAHPDRPMWDKTRRLVIQELLVKIQKQAGR